MKDPYPLVCVCPLVKSQAGLDNVLFPSPVGVGGKEPLRLLHCVEDGDHEAYADAVPARDYNHYVPLVKKKVAMKKNVNRKRGKRDKPAIVDPLTGLEDTVSHQSSCTLVKASTFFSKTPSRVSKPC